MRDSGLTRRQLLKRGAALGGALVWTTPVVQVIGLNPAFAQATSPLCNVFYAVKIERNEFGSPVCEDIAGQESGPGRCLDVPAGVVSGGCGKIDLSQVSALDGQDWVVVLPGDCTFQNGDFAIKTGDGSECVTDPEVEFDPETGEITFRKPTDKDISHVEFVFCCES